MKSIYIIKNTINSKVYIGQTKNTLTKRFQQHLQHASKGRGYVIGKAIRKYNKDNFYIELIEECEDSLVNAKEVYYINLYKTNNPKYGYNISEGGSITRLPTILDTNLVINLFKSGIPAYLLAKQFHTDITNITNILISNNIKYGLSLQKVDKELERLIILDYTQGIKTMQLTRKYNLNKSTIRRILIRYDIKLQQNRNLGRNLPTGI